MPNLILIVDDFKISNEVMSKLLEEMGYQTCSCQSGFEALELLNEIKIDIIISDYIMPKLNGIEFLKKVRELPGYNEVPVIILSSIDDPKIINTASDYNVSAWLKKPVNINQLTDVIKNLQLT